MKSVYVIFKDDQAIAAAFDEGEARSLIDSVRKALAPAVPFMTFRELPFYIPDGATITVVAGPIPEKYLNAG